MERAEQSDTRDRNLRALRIERSPKDHRVAGSHKGPLLAFAGALVAITLFAFWGLDRPSTHALTVVHPSIAGSVPDPPGLTATGYLVSREQAAVGAKASGRVRQILVEEGQRVGEGEILAILDHDDLDAAVSVAAASIGRARAEVKAEEATFAEHTRDLARKDELYRRGVAARSDFEAAQAHRDASKARLEALQRTVEVAEAEMKVAEAKRQNMIVLAPFAGTIISKDAQVGETITTGGMGAESGRGSIVTLADLNRLEVEADVKEGSFGQIHLGDSAVVTVDALPERRYAALLRHIVPMGDRSRAVIRVRVTITQPDEALFPEMSASVRFMAPHRDGNTAQNRTISVPTSTLWEANGERALWVVQDGRTRKVPLRSPLIDGQLLFPDAPIDLEANVVVHPPIDLQENVQVNTLIQD